MEANDNPIRFYPDNIYLFKVRIKALEKGVKYVQS